MRIRDPTMSLREGEGEVIRDFGPSPIHSSAVINFGVNAHIGFGVNKTGTSA